MIPKYQLTATKIFAIIVGVFLLGFLICISAYTIAKIRNDTRMTEAQIQNIGKPIIYEQHYFSPNKE